MANVTLFYANVTCGEANVMGNNPIVMCFYPNVTGRNYIVMGNNPIASEINGAASDFRARTPLKVLSAKGKIPKPHSIGKSAS